MAGYTEDKIAHIELALESWAKWRESGFGYRALWYPSSSIEGRLAKTGYVSNPNPPGPKTPADGADNPTAEKMDALLAKLKNCNAGYYTAIVTEYTEHKPREVKASLLNLTFDKYKTRIYEAKRWLSLRYESV